MGAATELHRLVDLALRSPDAGVVNFNHLHTLLHAILNQIGLSYDPRSGVLNTQLADSSDQANDKSTSFEQSDGNDKAVTEVDHSSRVEDPVVISDQLGSLPDQRSSLDRFDNLLVCEKFIKVELFEYANSLSC